jgi:hypothetical protein
VIALGASVVLLALPGCGGGGSSTDPGPESKLVSLQVVPGQSSVAKGTTQQFQATGSYSNGSSRDLTSFAHWQSANPKVASITSAGLATGLGVGTGTITASMGSTNGSASLTVTAATLTAIAVSPAQASIPAGRTQPFTATGTFSDGSLQDITANVSWASSAPEVAVISPSGLATAKKLGSATITAALNGLKDTSALTVTAALLVTIEVSPNPVSIPIGETQQFAAMGTYSDGSELDITTVVSWTSSAPDVADVNSSGLATADQLGNATIIAALSGISGNSVVTVTQAALVSIEVSPNPASIPAGKTQQFTATGRYSDGSSKDITAKANWSSSAPDIAKINSSGLATAKKTGDATIIARWRGVSGNSNLTVTPAVLVSLVVSPQNVAILFGKTLQFTATGTYSDGNKQDVTSKAHWNSSAPEVANVDASGLAASKSVGTTNIIGKLSGLHSSGTLKVLPVLQVNYFANAHSGLKQDATVRLTHPGSPHGDLCAMIYVFDQDQQISECCGCRGTANSLRTLSVQHDLTSNPLTGDPSTTGTIQIVAATAKGNPSCDAADFTPNGAFRAWATHLQVPSAGSVAITEGEFQDTLLTPDQQQNLQSSCASIKKLGSGHGICSCGKGD